MQRGQDPAKRGHSREQPAIEKVRHVAHIRDQRDRRHYRQAAVLGGARLRVREDLRRLSRDRTPEVVPGEEVGNVLPSGVAEQRVVLVLPLRAPRPVVQAVAHLGRPVALKHKSAAAPHQLPALGGRLFEPPLLLLIGPGDEKAVLDQPFLAHNATLVFCSFLRPTRPVRPGGGTPTPPHPGPAASDGGACDAARPLRFRPIGGSIRAPSACPMPCKACRGPA